MFCPRCGAENAADNRYCVSCGSSLKASEQPGEPRKTIRDRLKGLIGRSRKERLITGATAAAIVVAVVSVIVIGPNDDEESASANPEADAACVQAKDAVAKAATEAQGKGQAGIQSYSAGLIAALLGFRQTAAGLVEPGESATQLDVALRDAAIEAATRARLAREGAEAVEINAQTQRLEEATLRVDDAIESLGLTDCASVRIVPAAPNNGG